MGLSDSHYSERGLVTARYVPLHGIDDPDPKVYRTAQVEPLYNKPPVERH
jgi:hypothetical protein